MFATNVLAAPTKRTFLDYLGYFLAIKPDRQLGESVLYSV